MRRVSTVLGMGLILSMFLVDPTRSQVVGTVEAKRIIAAIVAHKLESSDVNVLYLSVDFVDPDPDLLGQLNGLLRSGQLVQPISVRLIDGEKIGELSHGEAVALMFSELVWRQGSETATAYGVFCLAEASSSNFTLKKQSGTWSVVGEHRKGDAANCDEYFAVKKLLLG